jgi:hypothetical protein
MMESYVSRVKTLEELLKLRKETYVDMAFQRRACWDVETEREFLRSFSRGKCFNPVIVADVDKCTDYCREVEEPYQKFMVIKDRGFRFVSLDGQNRLNTLAKFFNNEVSLTGAFQDINGKQVRITNTFYKDMPLELQQMFKARRLMVLFEENSSYDEFYSTFTSVNGGLPLNRMELRNAKNTPVAEYVRKLAKLYEAAIVDTVKGLKTHRMEDYELLLKLMCLVHEKQATQPFNHDNMDAFYENGVGKMDFSLVYGDGFDEQIIALFDFISNVIAGACREVKKEELWAIAHSFNFFGPQLAECDVDLVDWGAAFESIMDAHEACYQKSAEKYARDTMRWKNSFRETKKPAVSGYYFQRIKVIDNSQHRASVIQELFEALQESTAGVPLVATTTEAQKGTPLTAEELIQALGTDDLVSLIESSEVIREYFVAKAGGLS